MTVPVNSGHRLGPGWVSCTEGPLTRRTKAEKQNKQFSGRSVDVTHRKISHRFRMKPHILLTRVTGDQLGSILVSGDTIKCH